MRVMGVSIWLCMELARLDWLRMMGWPMDWPPPIMATWARDCGRAPGMWAGDMPGVWAMPSPPPSPSAPWPGEGAGAINWGGLGLFILGGLGEGGGPVPRSSPLLT